jgi:hypothetical protein
MPLPAYTAFIEQQGRYMAETYSRKVLDAKLAETLEQLTTVRGLNNRRNLETLRLIYTRGCQLKRLYKLADGVGFELGQPLYYTPGGISRYLGGTVNVVEVRTTPETHTLTENDVLGPCVGRIGGEIQTELSSFYSSPESLLRACVGAAQANVNRAMNRLRVVTEQLNKLAPKKNSELPRLTSVSGGV